MDYEVTTEVETFDDIQSYCPDGMVLAMPQNEDEFTCMQQAILKADENGQDVSGSYMHIGGEFVDGAWVWPNGHLIEWFNWAPTNPVEGRTNICIKNPTRDVAKKEGWLTCTTNVNLRGVCQTEPNGMDACTWQLHEGKVALGASPTDKVYGSLSAAKSGCRGFGSVKCKAIVCNSARTECIIKDSKELQASTSGEKTYIPSEGCWDITSCTISTMTFPEADNIATCPTGETNGDTWPVLDEEGCKELANPSWQEKDRQFTAGNYGSTYPSGCWSTCPVRPWSQEEKARDTPCPFYFNTASNGNARNDAWLLCSEILLNSCR
jgi:hypothetical protein